MTTEPDPTLDDAPLDSAVGEAARPTRPPFDLRTQLACGSGFAVAVRTARTASTWSSRTRV